MMAATPIEKIERMRNLLAACLVGAFVGALIAFCFKVVPPTNKDLITYMVGQLSGMATTALAYYFANKVGADALDAKRAENTGKLADAITAAAGTSPAAVDGDVIRPGDDVTINKTEDPKP